MTGGPGQDERARSPGWLGALLLCVLLAAAGLPAPSSAPADRAHVELRCDRARGQRAVAIAALAAYPLRSHGATATPPWRAQPRARSITEGGLPPARAPTA